MFDQLEQVPSLCSCIGHDRARHWNGRLDVLVKSGVENPEASHAVCTSERVASVVHGREASVLYCCWNHW